MTADILIVDDETDIRNLIQGILEDEGYTIRQAGNSAQTYSAIEEAIPSLIILDIWLQNSEHDGLEILANIKEQDPDLPVLMISGHGTIETAVSAIKQGAYDFIEKPFKSDRLLLMIERALENAKLRRENKALKEKAEGPSELVGSSVPMTNLKNILEKVAGTNSRVLITGEPGTGKEVIARNLHKMSSRAEEPFFVLNCATMRPDRMEIELFGCKEGVMGEPATTGILEQADKGTLLLDEVADMPLETQGKIVRVLQEQKFQTLGSQEEIEVDVRIIASTNRNLLKEIEGSRFRKDLFYRLNVVPIQIPPLRDMVQDIEDLAYYFMDKFSKQSGLSCFRFTDKALMALHGYKWPGNVRQLRNAVERIMIIGDKKGNDDDFIVDIDSLPIEFIQEAPKANVTKEGEDLMALPLRESREVFEKEYLEFQVRRFGGNISKTAEFIGMERSALHRKIKLLGILYSEKQNKSGDSDQSIQESRKRA
jgi:two-component system nitrogen regulation response regulator NtrX